MIDRLYFISQQNLDDSHLISIKRALDAGCKLIQLRVKNQSPESVLDQALEARELCSAYGACFMINDFPEIALEATAHGVHLGFRDSSLLAARALLGSDFIIGGTANTYEDILQRVAEGADYIGVGPFRFTTTKQNLSPIIGLEGYRIMMAKLRADGIQTPIIAVGGIMADDVPELLEAGVYGFAFSGAITHSKNPPATVLQIQQAITDYLILTT